MHSNESPLFDLRRNHTLPARSIPCHTSCDHISKDTPSQPWNMSTGCQIHVQKNLPLAALSILLYRVALFHLCIRPRDLMLLFFPCLFFCHLSCGHVLYLLLPVGSFLISFVHESLMSIYIMIEWNEMRYLRNFCFIVIHKIYV
jgi:hypothetical protein